MTRLTTTTLTSFQSSRRGWYLRHSGQIDRCRRQRRQKTQQKLDTPCLNLLQYYIFDVQNKAATAHNVIITLPERLLGTRASIAAQNSYWHRRREQNNYCYKREQFPKCHGRPSDWHRLNSCLWCHCQKNRANIDITKERGVNLSPGFVTTK